MPHPVVSLSDVGNAIADAMAAGSEMLALVCSCAPATEVALAATDLRSLLAELDQQRRALDRQRLTEEVLRAHGQERYVDGVEDGIEVGRAQVLAEQAAEAAERRGHLRVIRQQRTTGSFPVLPRQADGVA
jgi:hypothetical protein